MRLKFKTPEPKTIRYRIHKPGSSKSPNSLSLTRSFIVSKTSRSPWPVRNKTPGDAQPNKNLLLTKLQSRKSEPKLHINPQFASNVLKIYFLPYFEEKTKTDHDRLRFSSYGKGSKTPEKQIYARLSDLLRQSLTQTQKELQDLRSSLDAVNKDKERYKQEALVLKKEIVQASINSGHQNFQQSIYKVSVANTDLSSSLLIHQVIAYKKKATKKIHRYFSLLKSVSTETSKNTNLKSKSKQLKFWHSLYQLVNQLSGESLKGIFYTLSSLINSENLESKVKALSCSLRSLSSRLESSQALNILSITSASLQHSNLVHKASKYIALRSSILKDLKSLKLLIIDKIDRLGINLTHTHEETENLSSEIETKEKEITDFTAEYESMSEKIREAQAVMRQDRLELLCRLCNCNYFEVDNFNWSCCTHSSEWGGEMYWCCGSAVKESLGCNKSRHVARDDEAEEEERERERIREMVQGEEKKKYCSSCKKEGHFAQDCSADPNLGGILREAGTKARKVRVRELMKSKHALFGKKKKRNWGEIRKEKMGFRDIEEIRAMASQSVSPSSTWTTSINFKDFLGNGDTNFRNNDTTPKARKIYIE